jgi:hypothetical protein
MPSRVTLQRQIQTKAKDRRKEILRKLPKHAKLSISLDCWTSPFQQAFMAVSGYFIDSEWEYREVLLDFKPLEGEHTGVNLSQEVLELLREYEIKERVLAITTDNASNNLTLVSSLQETHLSQGLSSDTIIIRVPCLAHVIQLSLKQLLGQIKANPVNENVESIWSEEHMQKARQIAKEYSIASTLRKV